MEQNSWGYLWEIATTEHNTSWFHGFGEFENLDQEIRRGLFGNLFEGNEIQDNASSEISSCSSSDLPLPQFHQKNKEKKEFQSSRKRGTHEMKKLTKKIIDLFLQTSKPMKTDEIKDKIKEDFGKGIVNASNIKRRQYDVLNVLVCVNVLNRTKGNKLISLPDNKRELYSYRKEIQTVSERIEQKKYKVQQLNDLYGSLKVLTGRNKNNHEQKSIGLYSMVVESIPSQIKWNKGKHQWIATLPAQPINVFDLLHLI